MLGRHLPIIRLATSANRLGSSITVGASAAQYAVPRDGMTVLQVLRHHAFPMDFDCLKGSCKKCELEVALEGDRASVLACQEEALNGMHVLLDVEPDAGVAKLREKEAREKAKKEMAMRRSTKTRDRSAVPAKTNKIGLDFRDRLAEVIAMQEVMESDRKPSEVLTELQKLLESLDRKQFFNAVQFCKVDDWIKKKKWGSDKKQASKVREYIYNRMEEDSAPEVESMAC